MAIIGYKFQKYDVTNNLWEKLSLYIDFFKYVKQNPWNINLPTKDCRYLNTKIVFLGSYKSDVRLIPSCKSRIDPFELIGWF